MPMLGGVRFQMTPAREIGLDSRDERATVVRYLVVLYSVGPVFALLGLALPHAADTKDWGILAIAGVAWLAAATIFVLRRRMPQWGIDVAVGLGSVLVSAAI